MATTPQNIAIIGGHGKIALLLTRLLADQGSKVTSVIRKAEQSGDIEAAGGTPLVADAETLSPEDFAEHLTGQQAVVFAAGAGGGGGADRTYAVDRDAAIATVNAARTAGASRFVMLSYFGASPDHGVPSDNDFFAYAEAKAAADAYLSGAPGLDWTIVAPSALTNEEGTGTIDVEADEASDVPRADVAAVIAAVLADPSTVGRTVSFNSGSTPVVEAIAATA